MNQMNIDYLFQQLKSVNILIVGDLILDHYISGDVNRISPEAPIPIVEVTGEKYTLGGAANVAANIKSLGARVDICGMIGDDNYGKFLLNKLGMKKISESGVVISYDRPTTLKTRVLSRDHQLIRIDNEVKDEPGSEIKHEIIKYIKSRVEYVDAIIIEDYGKGVISYDVLSEIIPYMTSKNKIVTVDPKSNHLPSYSNCTAITPNLDEARKLTNVFIGSDKDLVNAAENIKNVTNIETILITLGSKGIFLYNDDELEIVPAYTKHQVFDVSGAGDTVISMFTLAKCAGWSDKYATILSNIAAGIVVEKVGTAVTYPEEIKERFNHYLEKV